MSGRLDIVVNRASWPLWLNEAGGQGGGSCPPKFGQNSGENSGKARRKNRPEKAKRLTNYNDGKLAKNI